MSSRTVTVDGNEAVASVAYRAHEVIAIYPITPASPMGELSDAWAAKGKPNVWGDVPEVIEMQSEGGAAGTVHGALQAGSLTTTFTASQGLLLMLPNMYKIAGELTPFVMHVAARTVATHALSIFGDHSDVMAARPTGFALLCSGSVQEAHDFSLIAQAATLASRIPYLHFFDGFRTSHEIQKIEELPDETIRQMLDPDLIHAHRNRALTPDRPMLRGTAQNPDTFFQAREACNSFYDDCPAQLQKAMDSFAELTGRRYHLFDYHGHPQAERVVVLMGSGAETAHETVDTLVAAGERVGLLRVRLMRPFSVDAFVAALPASVRSLAVLDRTKEPGAVAEPIHLEVLAALSMARDRGQLSELPRVVGGRYGLSSKEFNPACLRAVFDNLAAEPPRDRFTVGIVDDVTHTSLPVDPTPDAEAPGRTRAVFYGLGSDGTVSANKNTIKILGRETDLQVQGYFVYDSKKAGAVTISHLRFGPEPIRSQYLVAEADFVACHQFDFLDRFDVLGCAAPGAKILLTSAYPAERVWEHLPLEVQEQILEKELQLHVIDAYGIAREVGLAGRINTIMQTAFFALADILPLDEAIGHIKEAIQKTYGKRGAALIERNFLAVDRATTGLAQVEIPHAVTTERRRPPLVPAEAPDLVQRLTSVMMAGRGDSLPVSAFPVDGTWPTATTQWEKRNIAKEIPVWDAYVCIQCNQCALVCPHAAIRPKVYERTALPADVPSEFLYTDYRAPDLQGLLYTLQVAPEDCTGCRLCVEVCPAKDRTNPRHKAIEMAPQPPIRERERRNYEIFLDLPEIDRSRITHIDAKGSQFFQPLFEYSGACAGCGETPYIKLLTQLFGDRLLIANATGCSSIYGGNLPTTPYTVNDDGRGPAWSNSLFEDNAEFGLGFRLAVESNKRIAKRLVSELADHLPAEMVSALNGGSQGDRDTDEEIAERRRQVDQLRQLLTGIDDPRGRWLESVVDYLVDKSVWLLGGDGWAYDIGYGGLDHVLSLDRDINVLVLDTEVYSNTGGQQSKATPLGAAAKFAAAGKSISKKDLGLEAMSYGHVYVASIAFGANMNHTVKVLREAESYPGPSLIIAYSPCIAHGYDLAYNAAQQKRLVSAGRWPLYRYDPRRGALGEPPLKLDSRAPNGKLRAALEHETRFRMVEKIDRERYKLLLGQAEREVASRYQVYRQLAGVTTHEAPVGDGEKSDQPTKTPAS